MLYYFSATVLFFLLCLAYAGYVLLTRIAVQKRMRELGFRVRMLARSRASHLSVLLNAHPLWLFFCDRLSVERERELDRLEHDYRIHTPYYRRRPVFFPTARLKLLTHRVERLEQYG